MSAISRLSEFIPANLSCSTSQFVDQWTSYNFIFLCIGIAFRYLRSYCQHRRHTLLWRTEKKQSRFTIIKYTSAHTCSLFDKILVVDLAETSPTTEKQIQLIRKRFYTSAYSFRNYLETSRRKVFCKTRDMALKASILSFFLWQQLWDLQFLYSWQSHPAAELSCPTTTISGRATYWLKPCITTISPRMITFILCSEKNRIDSTAPNKR
jgi:hypothetical protein